MELDEKLHKDNWDKFKYHIQLNDPSSLYQYIDYSISFLLKEITLLQQEIKELKNNGSKNSN